MGNVHVSIAVRKRHISAGVGATPTACPIALALNEQLGAGAASVGARKFRFFCKDGSITNEFDLPESVQSFISKFDNGEDVRPFEFRVQVPAEVLRG